MVAAAGAGSIAAIVIVLAYAASNGQVSEAMNVTKTDPAVTPKPEAKVADKVVHDKPGYTGKEEKQPAPTQPAPTQPAPAPAPTQPEKIVSSTKDVAGKVIGSTGTHLSSSVPIP